MRGRNHQVNGGDPWFPFPALDQSFLAASKYSHSFGFLQRPNENLNRKREVKMILTRRKELKAGVCSASRDSGNQGLPTLGSASKAVDRSRCPRRGSVTTTGSGIKDGGITDWRYGICGIKWGCQGSRKKNGLDNSGLPK
jgi:hypothetical protein